MSERQRLHIIFRKDAGARYLSHLDLMATLEFSLRRADLPVALTEGFNRRPRMSLVLPLILGYTGEREILELTLREQTDPSCVRKRLQAAVPPGITILEVQEVPPAGKSAAARVTSATYRVELVQPVPDLDDRVRRLLTDERAQPGDDMPAATIRSTILSLEAPNARTLRVVVAAGNDGTGRPEEVLAQLGVARDGARIARESIELAPPRDSGEH